MTRFNCIRTALAAAASVILLVPAVSVAQGPPDRDAREISSYALTDAALAKFTRATANLGDLSKTVSGNCDDDEGAGSLDENVAYINAIPGAQAAIESAGMTTREYLVFTWSLFQTGLAAWALEQPGGTLPPGVSKANVDFYRAHEQALNSLETERDSDPCSDSDEEEAEEPTE
jgi:hypothetical protein